MKRVASLYLPTFATDRIRRTAPLSPRSSVPSKPREEPATTGWRPGARWARAEDDKGSGDWLERRIARKTAQKAALQAEIQTLPLHQRPPSRELGRRSETMPHPFRAMSADEADAPVDRPRYDLAGAFWQHGREISRAMAKEVNNSSPAFAGEGDHAQHGGGARAKRALHRRFAAAPPPFFERSPSPGKPGEDLAPLVTVHRAGQRVVIDAACPAAAALGLGPGMALTQARALVSGLDVRDADAGGEASDLDRLARHAVRCWTPLVTPVSGEGLWLDIGAVTHLFGGEDAFARHVLNFCRRLGFAARVAIADTGAAAHALARCAVAPLTLCPPGAEAEAIASLPVAALRIDPEAAESLRRLGVDTAGALAGLPRAPLVRRFGAAIVARLDQALGRAAEPIDPIILVDPPSVERRLLEPIATADAIAQVLGDLVADFTTLLERRGIAARAVALIAVRVDGGAQRLDIGTAAATRDPAHLKRLLGMRIEAIDPGFGIEAMRLVGGRVEPLGPRAIDGALAGGGTAPDLAPLVDRLAARLGGRRLFRIGAVESDVPERAMRRIHPLAVPVPWRDRWPRPVRLLPRPERIDNVVALLPDGAPRRFSWRGRSYRVRRADGPERIFGEWWRRTAEADSVRDYFQVEDEAGARFWLYRRGDGLDPRTGDLSWHLHGMFG